MSRFAILLRGMVRALGWENYPGVAGGLFILVGADGDYFRDGTEPFIAIFLGFWAIFLWPHMQKRVNSLVLSIYSYIRMYLLCI